MLFVLVRLASLFSFHVKQPRLPCVMPGHHDVLSLHVPSNIYLGGPLHAAVNAGAMSGLHLQNIPNTEYNAFVSWEAEYTDEFGQWWQTLSESQQDAVVVRVELLIAYGPELPYPYSSDVRGSRHGVMRELRAQSHGRPLRVFYAFDPRRTSILLIGGDKSGNDRFYEEYVPIADDLYDEHLEELRREGLIE